MRTFDINEFKKHPKRKLVIQHYRKDLPETWVIEEAQVTIGNCLVIKSPDTGYDLPEYILLSGSNEVSDTDGNPVGTIEFMTEEISVEKFAERLLLLAEGDTMDFTFGSDDRERSFCAAKIRQFDIDIIIIDGYGVMDVTGMNNPGDLVEQLKSDFTDYLEESVFIDLCPKTEKELWGVTFEFEEENGRKTRRLAVTDCDDLFETKQEAEKWISEHKDGSYDSDFDAEYSGSPKVVLIDKWRE